MIKNNVNIAFFGTSDRSTPILDALKNNFNLRICITKTDSIVGRHQDKKESGVKTWCKQNKVEFYEISSLKGQEAEIVYLLLENGIDLGVVADFSFMITEKIINTPAHKLINIHFSLLPKYRGASPIQHAILQGEQKTGVTYYVMDKGMDTGGIIHAFEQDIYPHDTSLSLNEHLFTEAAKYLPSVINSYISNKITPIPQNPSDATYCWSKTNPKTTMVLKDDAKIDWNLPIEQIERSIRAFYPWPIAWTTVGNLQQNAKLVTAITFKTNISPELKVKIYSAVVENGLLKPKEIQIEGKNKINWESFLNGYNA